MILPPDQRSPHPGGETAPQFKQAPPTPVARKRRRARAPPLLREYLTKRDLVLLVPLSMTTIDRLERKRHFYGALCPRPDQQGLLAPLRGRAI